MNTLGILNPTEYKLNKGLKCNNKLQFDGVKAEWSTRTIRRMLKNEMYIGNMVQRTCQKVSYKIKKNISLPESQHIVVEGTHEAIIDRSTFDLVQARFEKDSWQRKGAIAPDEQEDTGAILLVTSNALIADALCAEQDTERKQIPFTISYVARTSNGSNVQGTHSE